MNNYLAVDIGASSGRLVSATLQGEQIHLQELHRFNNSFTERNGHDYWNIDNLFDEIIQGLQKAKQNGIDSCTLGIDTWAVDYVLLNKEGHRIHEVYAYRDARTLHAPDKLHQLISREEVYEKTGIQELNFNTLYQLFAHDREQLAQADKILMVPDYLYYRLTGIMVNEMTNASTMQLLNVNTREFDEDLLSLLQLRRNQFSELAEPGRVLGSILPELVRKYDLPDCQLILVPTHDTASAVAGVPSSREESWAYISSGTWSLLGMERSQPLNTETAMQANYTNEWGAYGTYRFLKNIMGLWMIQEVRREGGSAHSFAELAQLASAETPFVSLVLCNQSSFLNPDSMTLEIQRFCEKTGQPVPRTPGALARCIFESLALSYRDALHELQHLTDETITRLHIVGGGANNELLCQLTADLLEIEVQAGPSESTAIGNIVVQLISSGALGDLKAAGRTIANSFPTRLYEPQPVEGMGELLDRWERLKIQATPPIHISQ
ncbi:rhamnulokinase [Paenibacillus sp. EKM102P]|uniref:rhamnulokinase n=1 Tax=unclassified Paenibacillus TaxID=185978 RepID=UPI00142D5E62|nr:MULTISPECIES: rhamnulokinase [unclassified Paenibacillus]KAF6621452.1 rhamnulokinase [Paenibacillus sp. EKM101P]KAF6622757.1 rhamnulokinase [Paenibacillus sp. EKM102P]KAF6632609.1 rhamnulokinase [Paenibacillus sp. EKM10P]KAF6647361.1 rhamnulokinase [Paenibacillus sp. EKM11P]